MGSAGKRPRDPSLRALDYARFAKLGEVMADRRLAKVKRRSEVADTHESQAWPCVKCTIPARRDLTLRRSSDRRWVFEIVSMSGVTHGA
jgi:hypothetical protein